MRRRRSAGREPGTASGYSSLFSYLLLATGCPVAISHTLLSTRLGCPLPRAGCLQPRPTSARACHECSGAIDEHAQKAGDSGVLPRTPLHRTVTRLELRTRAHPVKLACRQPMGGTREGGI